MLPQPKNSLIVIGDHIKGSFYIDIYVYIYIFIFRLFRTLGFREALHPKP